MQKKCTICGAIFDTATDRKTCSTLCRLEAQRRTLGRAPSQLHGFAKPGRVERLHGIWRGMIKRCYNPKFKSFSRYGGRGIYVDEVWRTDYTKFRDWAIASGYSDGLTIGRVDNDGPYAPTNCAWESPQKQARNRSSSHFLTFNGETKTIAEWAELFDIPYCNLVTRINVYRWDTEKALTTPTIKPQQYIVDGNIYTIHELAQKHGIKEATLRYRLKRMPLQEAISEKECRGQWRKKRE